MAINLSTDPDGDGRCSRDDVCPDDIDNDSDGDGVCVGSAFHPPAVGGGDPCSRTGTAGEWIKPTVVLSALDQPPGKHRVSIHGAFVIPSGGPALAPQASGIQVRVTDAAGGIVLDEHIPGIVGWKVTGNPPSKFTYRDKTGRRNGIELVTITDRSARTPGEIAVQIVGDHGTYALTPAEAPISLAVELNDLGDPPGASHGIDQCGETRFGLAPAAPGCTLGRAR